jgi:arabinofuranan 3-O-arabinosyltransferase
VNTSTNYPWETFLILAVWIWCGWRLVRGEERRGGETAVNDEM